MTQIVSLAASGVAISRNPSSPAWRSSCSAVASLVVAITLKSAGRVSPLVRSSTTVMYPQPMMRKPWEAAWMTSFSNVDVLVVATTR